MKRFFKNVFVLLLGSGSALYLLNLGWGFAELIPDNLAVGGNIDEAVASLLLIYSAGYFGIGPWRRARAAREEKPAEAVEVNELPALESTSRVKRSEPQVFVSGK